MNGSDWCLCYWSVSHKVCYIQYKGGADLLQRTVVDALVFLSSIWEYEIVNDLLVNRYVLV